MDIYKREFWLQKNLASLKPFLLKLQNGNFLTPASLLLLLDLRLGLCER
jgi:hypothetical protein